MDNVVRKTIQKVGLKQTKRGPLPTPYQLKPKNIQEGKSNEMLLSF